MKKSKKIEELTHRICSICHEDKYIYNFRKQPNAKDKSGYNSICKDCLSKIKEEKDKNEIKRYYVYRFLDSEDNVIYIGKTNNLKQRMNTHFSPMGGHLPYECYHYVKTIEFVEFVSEYKMSIYEIQLMYFYKCKYNSINTNEFDSIFSFPQLNWEIYGWVEESIGTYGFDITTKQESDELYNRLTVDKYVL
jgi:predicted GIY-YIG superfamily endonuclease